MSLPRPPRIRDPEAETSRVFVPDALNWFLWRPVAAGKAQRSEIENEWTLADVAECHILLDTQEDAEAEARIRSRRRRA